MTNRFALAEPAVPLTQTTTRSWLSIALAEAQQALAEGNDPVGAAMFAPDGMLLGSGHNRITTTANPLIHAEIDAFHRSAALKSYTGATLVTTVAPCWYCSGMVRFFGISRLIVGVAGTLAHGAHWLEQAGVEVVIANDEDCVALFEPWLLDHVSLIGISISPGTADTVRAAISEIPEIVDIDATSDGQGYLAKVFGRDKEGTHAVVQRVLEVPGVLKASITVAP